MGMLHKIGTAQLSEAGATFETVAVICMKNHDLLPQAEHLPQLHPYCGYCRVKKISRVSLHAPHKGRGFDSFGWNVLERPLRLGQSSDVPSFNCPGSGQGIHGGHCGSEEAVTEVQHHAMSGESRRHAAVCGLVLNGCSYREVWLTIDHIAGQHHVLCDFYAAHRSLLMQGLLFDQSSNTRGMMTEMFCSIAN